MVTYMMKKLGPSTRSSGAPLVLIYALPSSGIQIAIKPQQHED